MIKFTLKKGINRSVGELVYDEVLYTSEVKLMSEKGHQDVIFDKVSIEVPGLVFGVTTFYFETKGNPIYNKNSYLYKIKNSSNNIQ